MASGVKTTLKALHAKHPELLEAQNQKVLRHTQRREGEWVIHTLMIEGVDAPFQFRRPKELRPLEGCRVNLSYYIDSQKLAGEDFEVMKVVRVRRS
ncbi:MAG: hypothetical protein R3183_01885 [Oleiphilaceae bacterium]|nr:hypothetical protein [Oleiphilaceae bacterium]